MESAEDLATIVRDVLASTRRIREVKMFGGTCFLLNDNITVAASKRGLLVRVGKEGHDDALTRPGSRPMVMKGREMTGYIRVDPSHLTPAAVHDWVQLAVAHVRTLPPKAARSARKTARKKSKHK